MRTPLQSRRPPVLLTVSAPDERPDDHAGDAARVPYLPWAVAAVGWSLGAVALGWLAVGMVVAAGWLTAPRTSLTAVVATIGQGWLAAHAVPARLGELVVGITPLGVSAVLVAGCAAAAHHAATQYVFPAELDERRRWLTWAAIAGTCVATYAVGALVLGTVVGTPAQGARVLLGALAVSVPGAGYGAARGLGLDPLATLPAWVRALRPAVGVGLATLAAGSLIALVTGLILAAERVGQLHSSLAPDAAGAALLVAAQLAFWPNLLLWSGAYALGAGVALGGGTVATPASGAGGILPAIPVWAAVPTWGSPYVHAWAAIGVVAGGVAAWWLLRRLRADGEAPRWATWPALGALAGLATGAAWVALSAASGGDLGTNRLTGLGPVFPDLLWWGTLPGVGGGAVVAVAYLLWAKRRRAASPADHAATPIEPPALSPATPTEPLALTAGGAEAP